MKTNQVVICLHCFHLYLDVFRVKKLLKPNPVIICVDCFHIFLDTYRLAKSMSPKMRAFVAALGKISDVLKGNR